MATTYDLDLLGVEKPAKVPNIPPPTEAAGLRGAIESSQDAFTADLEAKAAAAQGNAGYSYEQLIKGLTDSEGEIARTDREYRRTGVDTAEQELKDINQRILEEEHALRRKVEKIDENAIGASEFGASVLKDREERKSLSTQADLAVIQLAKQGRFDSAKAIADRAVAAKFERQTMRNNILQFIYEENKDLFTTAEKRAFETKQADRNRKLDMEAEKEIARFNQIIDQENARFTAGLKAETEEPDEKEAAKVELVGLLNQYRSELENSNFLSRYLDPNKVANLNTIRGQITAVYKKAQQLGTLDAGVQKLVNTIVPDPNNVNIVSLSKDAQISAIDNFIANQGGDLSVDENADVTGYDAYLQAIGG